MPLRGRRRSDGRRLVHGHDIGKRPVEQRVIATHERLQGLGQQGELGRLAVEQARAVLAQDDMRFVGPAGCVGHIHDHAVVLVDDPPPIRELRSQQRARCASPEALVGGDLQPRHGRHEGIRVDLAMRVAQGDPHLDPAIFEDEHVVDVLACAELLITLTPDPHQRLGALACERSERRVVVVRVHDHLGRPLGRLERRKAVVEHHDLKCGKRDLGLWTARLRRAQRAVIARRQKRALLAVDRIDDLLTPQLLEAELAHRDPGSGSGSARL